jgi:uncharacterized protein YceH (UPF0502 family)
MDPTPSPPSPPERRWGPLIRSSAACSAYDPKAKTTPAGYPMSVNGIVAGCNQKNNREPITAYDDFDVEKALSEMQTLGLVKEIDWVGRVPKYKHLAYEWLGVKPVELAVLGELLLRGTQSVGDLRGRASRMEPIADLSVLKPVVDGLVERGLMLELTPPGRGQLVTHGLYSAQELGELRAGEGRHGRPERPEPAPSPAEPAAPSRPDLAAELRDLRSQLAELRERVERLEGSGEAQG